MSEELYLIGEIRAKSINRVFSNLEKRKRSAIFFKRTSSRGTMEKSRNNGSGGSLITRSVSISGRNASIPHFSVSGRIIPKIAACRIHKSARVGSGAESIFLTSDHTRSADNCKSPSFRRAHALIASASGRPLPTHA